MGSIGQGPVSRQTMSPNGDNSDLRDLLEGNLNTLGKQRSFKAVAEYWKRRILHLVGRVCSWLGTKHHAHVDVSKEGMVWRQTGNIGMRRILSLVGRVRRHRLGIKHHAHVDVSKEGMML